MLSRLTIRPRAIGLVVAGAGHAVGRARDLPDPEVLGVVDVEPDEMRGLELAVHHDDRRVEIGADRGADTHRDRALFGSGRASLPHREQERVEHGRVAVERVDEGDEAHGRLRTAGRDQSPDVEPVQWIDRRRPRRGDRETRLVEDVERTLVAGVMQRVVALGVVFEEWLGAARPEPVHARRVAVQADLLRAHADPGVALEDLAVGRRGLLEPSRDVLPVHDDRAVEPLGALGAHDQHAGAVRRLAVRLDLPATVDGGLGAAAELVTAEGAVEPELLHHVAVDADVDPGPARRGVRADDRTDDGRRRDRSASPGHRGAAVGPHHDAGDEPGRG